MSTSLSPLESLAPEILECIAFCVMSFGSSFLGPPSEWLTLCLISRRFYDTISFNNNTHLCALVFRFKFDDAAAFRRLTERWLTTRCLAIELRKRFTALQRIRYKQEYRQDDLWTAYLMMLENDGKNESQLHEWAGINAYIYNALVARACAPLGSPLVWLWDAEGSALIIWLLWMTVNREGIRMESPAIYHVISHVLHPFIVAGYRYPSIHAPDSHFYLPLCSRFESPAPSCSGPMPAVANVIHYGHQLTLAAPVPTSPALLAMTVRLEAYQDVEPIPRSLRNLPRDRETANSLGLRGATLEDVNEFHCRTRIQCPERCPMTLNSEDDERAELLEGSKRYDEDWSRLVSCYSLWMDSPPLRGKVYTPGALSGSWAGRLALPGFEAHLNLVLNPQRSPASVPLVHQPLYWTLYEHHCLHPDQPVWTPVDETGGDDIMNAWLPRGLIVKVLEDAIEVYDPNTEQCSRYETVFPNRAQLYSKSACERLQTPWISDSDEEIAEEHSDSDSANVNLEPTFPDMSHIDNDTEYSDKVSHHSSGVADILITGETRQRYGDAWGHYNIIGRVRPWDGLVVLLRTPRDRDQAHLGQWMFKGYIHDQNLVGRWRETSTAINMVGFEGSFVVCKQDHE